tara:strand:+ start:10839 stop:11171 length:333 start_codon:yes stop_codon:yes gene_type:complete
MKIEVIISICLAGVFLILLSGLILWASMESNVMDGFQQLIETRWGMTTLVDIYIALTFIGTWIGVMENSLAKGILWTLALYIIGNIATLVYFIYRASKYRSLNGIFLPQV